MDLVTTATSIMSALGEWGVGLLVLVETVFPPIPSEVILPLAGFSAQQGLLNIWLVVIVSVAASLLGALLLYWLGATVGEERVVSVLSRLPLVDRADFERAAHWFHRHGRSAVFFGRLIPGVRSLIPLPAGAAMMPLGLFSALTVAGSTIWNTALISLGYALGTQYGLVAGYIEWLDWAVYGAVFGVLLLLVVRSIRRKRSA